MNTIGKIIMAASLAVAPLQAEAQNISIRSRDAVSHQHNRFWTALPYQQDWGQYRYANNRRGFSFTIQTDNFYFSYEERPQRQVYSPCRRKPTVCHPMTLDERLLRR